MQYLLDTDVLVSSKRLHYHPDFCQLFWDWIDHGHGAGTFFSLDRVKDELMGGDEEDVLHQWCVRPGLKNFFLPSKPSTPKWGELSQWATSRQPQFLPAAIAKFLNVKSADAWLIAHAASNQGWTVVTNEVSAPEAKRDVKLPDAAKALGVQTINLNELLRKHSKHNFTFSK